MMSTETENQGLPILKRLVHCAGSAAPGFGGLILGVLFFTAGCATDSSSEDARAVNQALDATAAGPAQRPANLIVTLREGMDPTEFAEMHGMQLKRTMERDTQTHVYATESAEAANLLLEKFQTHPSVRAAYLEQLSENEPTE